DRFHFSRFGFLGGLASFLLRKVSDRTEAQKGDDNEESFHAQRNCRKDRQLARRCPSDVADPFVNLELVTSDARLLVTINALAANAFDSVIVTNTFHVLTALTEQCCRGLCLLTTLKLKR